jgi:hypothetical protein
LVKGKVTQNFVKIRINFAFSRKTEKAFRDRNLECWEEGGWRKLEENEERKQKGKI